MSNEFNEIDITEMEKQRSKAIKDNGEYLELNVLIGVKNSGVESDDGSKIPVITINMHRCRAEEVGCLYVTLQEIIRSLEKQYPMECLLAKLGSNITKIGTSHHSFNDDEED